MTTQTALIIGASRGLGLGLVREYLRRRWHVTGTVRETISGTVRETISGTVRETITGTARRATSGTARTALHGLADEHPGQVAIETVDINQPGQVAALRERLAHRRFDLLFVNAGVSSGRDETVGMTTDETFIRVMVTNALSPMRVVEQFESLVPATGAIALMSSGLGSVTNNETGEWEIYRASKASLNTLMRSFAARHACDPRTLLLIAPGWVRTDMGGPDALLDVDTSIRGVADAIATRTGKPGLHYVNYQGNIVPW